VVVLSGPALFASFFDKSAERRLSRSFRWTRSATKAGTPRLHALLADAEALVTTCDSPRFGEDLTALAPRLRLIAQVPITRWHQSQRSWKRAQPQSMMHKRGSVMRFAPESSPKPKTNWHKQPCVAHTKKIGWTPKRNSAKQRIDCFHAFASVRRPVTTTPKALEAFFPRRNGGELVPKSLRRCATTAMTSSQ
jgi:lambda repressor-like predicted transcriptional regulator